MFQPVVCATKLLREMSQRGPWHRSWRQRQDLWSPAGVKNHPFHGQAPHECKERSFSSCNMLFQHFEISKHTRQGHLGIRPFGCVNVSFVLTSINCTSEFINISKVLHFQPSVLEKKGFHWLSLKITGSFLSPTSQVPKRLPPKTSAALFVSKDAPFNKEMGKTALASCHFGRSPRTEM